MKEVENFERNDIFQRYNDMQNPFIIVTVPIKVTNLVNYAKIHKHFYALFGYFIGKVVNEIDAFKYRYINKKYYLCDKIGVSYTEKIDDGIVFLIVMRLKWKSFWKNMIGRKNKY